MITDANILIEGNWTAISIINCFYYDILCCLGPAANYRKNLLETYWRFDFV